MPRLTCPYDPDVGPEISVTVSDPLGYRSEDDSPKSEKVIMLLDSGASDSSISEAVAARLSLPVLGLHRVSGFGASADTYQYLADLELWLDVGHELSDRKLLQFSSDHNRIQGILGRDILGLAKFYLDGQNREFTIEF